jgi:putative sterol carrier protein
MAKTPKAYMKYLKTKMSDNPDAGKNINAIYQFVLEGKGGGQWWLDFTKSPGEIGEGMKDEIGCTISMNASDFVAMMEKSANPVALFMLKKLKVTGDLALALKLQSIINLL